MSWSRRFQVVRPGLPRRTGSRTAGPRADLPATPSWIARHAAFAAGGAFAALVAAGLLVCGAAQAANVTADRSVRDEVSLAQAYWQIEEPTLAAPCPVQVFEGPLTAALGEAGAIEPATDVWAETVDGSCNIVISPSMWQAVHRGDAYDTYNTCIAFAHEYGHTLGLPDAPTPAIMNFKWTKASQVDPLCGQYTYGWSRVSGASRSWLTAHGLARHGEIAAARA
jgi:hypothetical protein